MTHTLSPLSTFPTAQAAAIASSFGNGYADWLQDKLTRRELLNDHPAINTESSYSQLNKFNGITDRDDFVIGDTIKYRSALRTMGGKATTDIDIQTVLGEFNYKSMLYVIHLIQSGRFDTTTNFDAWLDKHRLKTPMIVKGKPETSTTRTVMSYCGGNLLERLYVHDTEKSFTSNSALVTTTIMKKREHTAITAYFGADIALPMYNSTFPISYVLDPTLHISTATADTPRLRHALLIENGIHNLFDRCPHILSAIYNRTCPTVSMSDLPTNTGHSFDAFMSCSATDHAPINFINYAVLENTFNESTVRDWADSIGIPSAAITGFDQVAFSAFRGRTGTGEYDGLTAVLSSFSSISIGNAPAPAKPSADALPIFKSAHALGLMSAMATKTASVHNNAAKCSAIYYRVGSGLPTSELRTYNAATFLHGSPLLNQLMNGVHMSGMLKLPTPRATDESGSEDRHKHGYRASKVYNPTIRTGLFTSLEYVGALYKAAIDSDYRGSLSTSTTVNAVSSSTHHIRTVKLNNMLIGRLTHAESYETLSELKGVLVRESRMDTPDATAIVSSRVASACMSGAIPPVNSRVYRGDHWVMGKGDNAYNNVAIMPLGTVAHLAVMRDLQTWVRESGRSAIYTIGDNDGKRTLLEHPANPVVTATATPYHHALTYLIRELAPTQQLTSDKGVTYEEKLITRAVGYDTMHTDTADVQRVQVDGDEITIINYRSGITFKRVSNPVSDVDKVIDAMYAGYLSAVATSPAAREPASRQLSREMSKVIPRINRARPMLQRQNKAIDAMRESGASGVDGIITTAPERYQPLMQIMDGFNVYIRVRG